LSDAKIAEDVRDLRRGVMVTYIGYGLKLGMPLLLALATRTYGAERWGVFLASQAILLIAVRVALLGLDKGLLWLVAGQSDRDPLRGVRSALTLVGLTSVFTVLVIWLVPGWLGLSGEAHIRALRIGAFALVPFALSELFVYTAMGQRRMELQVFVRETINPIVQVASALALWHLDVRDDGLAWSFVVSHCVGLVLAVAGFRRLFRHLPWPKEDKLALPPGLMRYAAPLWLAEMSNSVVLRLDTLVLTALATPALVGVWGIVGQFANALRQMRRAYDPIVTAITARIAVNHDARRLAETFSYAAQMVSLTQLPVFAALFQAADVIMPLYGPEYAAGTTSLMVLVCFFLLSGGTGLAGLVVNGYGRSAITLVNTLGMAALELGLLYWLVPQYGLVGASIALGGALCTLNVVQLFEMRAITGSFNQTRRSGFTVGIITASIGALLGGILLSRQLHLPPWPARIVPLVAFLLVYGPLCLLGLRSGLLRAPASQAAA
jgi:O-antigen/teichoic acid export membrane protein